MSPVVHQANPEIVDLTTDSDAEAEKPEEEKEAVQNENEPDGVYGKGDGGGEGDGGETEATKEKETAEEEKEVIAAKEPEEHVRPVEVLEPADKEGRSLREANPVGEEKQDAEKEPVEATMVAEKGGTEEMTGEPVTKDLPQEKNDVDVHESEKSDIADEAQLEKQKKDVKLDTLLARNELSMTISWFRSIIENHVTPERLARAGIERSSILEDALAELEGKLKVAMEET
ncbi:hypothetical protein BJ508DRAFT_19240 [Ascobolus immersus RN42]|uniref:Uncharacterized protein n=1 Tax=Ascobolus immersus RN42 TaxID=1160509 RepID=A0A3N4HSH0_ASCIM|nr:hypothetical protein BJ508DRAFT_19240 [Ascobolus immersus RN42]